MNPIEQQVIEGFRILPPEKQQTVLDFVEFLVTRVEATQNLVSEDASEKSLSEAVSKYIGCVNGPPDLSTNKAYMEGFGES